MMKFLLIKIILMIALLTGCAKKESDLADLKIYISPAKNNILAMTAINKGISSLSTSYAPTDVSGFECILINVIGPGIGNWDANASRVGNGDKFSYFGVYSKLIPVSTGGEVQLKIKKGSKRYIQMLGVRSTVGCPSNLSESDLSSLVKFPGMFMIGQSEQSVANDTQVTLNNNYNSTSAEDIRGSDGKPTSPSIDNTPPTPGTGISGSTTSSSVILTWGAASDNITVTDSLKYKVVQGTSSADFSNVAKAEENGTVVMDWKLATLTKSITGLSSGTTYKFAVIVKDVSSPDNKAIYTAQSYTTNSSSSFSVTYDSNGATSGSVPTDSNSYSNGGNVTVLGNTGGLLKTGYTLSGWCLDAGCTGATYSASDKYSNIDGNVIFYAKWTLVVSTFSVTYDSNGATSGSVPTDSNSYSSGGTVTVLANTESLQKSGYVFSGWNTQANSSGISYTSGNNFTINANTTLYAVWSRVVHVSGGGSDISDGSINEPFLTIAYALSTINSNEAAEIRVAGGVYNISSAIILKNNITLKGGYNSDFSLNDPSVYTTSLRPTSSGAFTYISATSLTGAQVIEGFNIDHDGVGHTSDYVGVDINNSSNTSVKFCNFVMNGTGLVYPIKITGAYVGVINGNFINPIENNSAGTSVNAINFTTIETGSSVKIFNNVVYSGLATNGSNIPKAINIASGSGTISVYLRNNTIIASSKNGTKTYGFQVNGPTTNLYADNNIFTSSDNSGPYNPFGIGCNTACTVESMKNNNFDLLDGAFDNTNTSYPIGSLPTTSAYSGNINVSMSGYFTSVATLDFSLNEATPASIVTGGLDGNVLSWGITNDKLNSARTGNGATGWSIGAFEK